MRGVYIDISILSLFFFLAFVCLFPSLNAEKLNNNNDSVTRDPVHEDGYWDARAKEAQKLNENYFDPDPYNVTDDIRSNVVQFLKGDMNNTRRGLARKGKKGVGPCKASNPVDRCWRCDPKWADNRKKLAECAQGFGRRATGGKDGRFYVVTDPSDDDLINPKPGTLRHAVIQTEPLWITFARSMIITLRQELIMTSKKTVDGRGANVHISGGAGITIQAISNVIIHNIHIHDIVPKRGGMIRDSVNHYGIRTKSDGDGISIFSSSNIWIDHNSMYRCTDGIIDIIMASTGVTISNNHFTHHDEVMLFGAHNEDEEDKIMQVTVAFNNFGKGLVQRMPRCRFGFFHVLNNDYTHWKMYAIGGSQNPTIISEGNRFIAQSNLHTKEITKRIYAPQSVWKNWQWRSIDDEFVNGAYFVQSGPKLREKPFSKLDMIPATKGKAVSTLTREAGTLICRPGKPC